MTQDPGLSNNKYFVLMIWTNDKDNFYNKKTPSSYYRM